MCKAVGCSPDRPGERPTMDDGWERRADRGGTDRHDGRTARFRAVVQGQVQVQVLFTRARSGVVRRAGSDVRRASSAHVRRPAHARSAISHHRSTKGVRIGAATVSYWRRSAAQRHGLMHLAADYGFTEEARWLPKSSASSRCGEPHPLVSAPRHWSVSARLGPIVGPASCRQDLWACRMWVSHA